MDLKDFAIILNPFTAKVLFIYLLTYSMVQSPS